MGEEETGKEEVEKHLESVSAHISKGGPIADIEHKILLAIELAKTAGVDIKNDLIETVRIPINQAKIDVKEGGAPLNNIRSEVLAAIELAKTAGVDIKEAGISADAEEIAKTILEYAKTDIKEGKSVEEITPKIKITMDIANSADGNINEELNEVVRVPIEFAKADIKEGGNPLSSIEREILLGMNLAKTAGIDITSDIMDAVCLPIKLGKADIGEGNLENVQEEAIMAIELAKTAGVDIKEAGISADVEEIAKTILEYAKIDIKEGKPAEEIDKKIIIAINLSRAAKIDITKELTEVIKLPIEEAKEVLKEKKEA